MLEELASAIRQDPQFQNEFSTLIRNRLRQSLYQTIPDSSESDLSIDRLVQSAGFFSLSKDAELQQMAFRIATSAFELYGESLGGLADVLKLVMSRLGNFPALDFRKEIMLRPSSLPTVNRFETEYRRAGNAVAIGGADVSLTDYQRGIWSDLKLGSSLISSAPTSAGKSFMFQSHIVEQLAAGEARIAVFIVPTRALIGQVSATFLDMISRREGVKIRVASVSANSTEPAGSTVYVMTQERVQTLLIDPTFLADIVVVDEAHLIGESDRGIILQTVIEDLLERKADAQLLFTLPRVRNPEAFRQIFHLDELKVRKTNDSPVGQNIVLLDVDQSIPDNVRATLWRGKRDADSTEIHVDRALVEPDQKLVYLAWYFGRRSQNIIYGGSQAKCENLSRLLCDVIGDDEQAHSGAREDLAKFVRDHVHSKYMLADTVLKGVGFHYGHIPTLVRKAIEDAFEARQLDFIVCTSTLLQGVNLPARNIFMHRPEKGEGEAISPVDFWNLAGRAGRLGKEFEGNVYLVDYSEWDRPPLDEPQEPLVEASMRQQVVHDTENLLAFIGDRTAGAGANPTFENAFSRLFKDFRAGNLERTLDRMDVPTEVRERVVAKLGEVAASITVPSVVLTANPYVSPHMQQKLYVKLTKRLKEKGVDYLMPPHPAGEWKVTQSRMINVFRRLQYELEGQKGDMYKRWATIALNWMRGRPLPDIIQYAFDRDDKRVAEGVAAGKRVRPSKAATIIRSTLKEIEYDLRFRFVRLTSCYNAVWKQVLIEAGHERAAAHIPAIPLFLEVGASSTSMLSFIELGLSRITARLLQQRSADYDMSVETAERWLRRQNLANLDIPEVCIREILPLVS